MQNYDIPFAPSNIELRELLRKKYISEVSSWLLGKNEMSILSQASGSAWESALTVITLSEVSKIFSEKDEELELRSEITRKSILVADWLLSRRITTNEEDFVHWEGVTWDTAVIIQALLIIVSEFKDNLSQSKINEIESVAVKGCKWLYYRFNQWDNDIKYPFGSADVAKLIVTFAKFHEVNPGMYKQLKTEYKENFDQNDDGCWLSTIVEHLLHGKTEEKSLSDDSENVIMYWWDDDYFTTAEVTEGLAVYYNLCTSEEGFENCDLKLIEEIKDSLVRACTYFEQGQVDGMWGSHIDTIKVIYSYVLIRRLVHNNKSNEVVALIEPEIHTVFKALRWMCDDKQRFSDGSFMHTMFLTVFYAAALVEVYKSWEPAKHKIDKVYDDVVWASPVRTTPERIKRLSVEIKNSNLETKLNDKDKEINELIIASEKSRYKLTNTVIVLFVILALLPLTIYIGLNVSGIKIAADTSNLVFADLLTYISTVIPLFGGLIALIWKRGSIYRTFSKLKN